MAAQYDGWRGHRRRVRFPSARKSRARHRPQCQGTSPSTPAYGLH